MRDAGVGLRMGLGLGFGTESRFLTAASRRFGMTRTLEIPLCFAPVRNDKNLPGAVNSGDRGFSYLDCFFLRIRLGFGLNVPEDSEVNLVDDGIRPQTPVGGRPESVMIPGSSFQASSSVGQRSEQELSAFRD